MPAAPPRDDGYAVAGAALPPLEYLDAVRPRPGAASRRVAGVAAPRPDAAEVAGRAGTGAPEDAGSWGR